ncbi:hypothetical protein [Lewinella sp. IMCC34191]|uniref:hypothetical protein n=1 Tax=Lewinella sp. IMCC34191 TaxID=2259172 RepID=UPI000E2607C2|nr:hypothetical protein [Lewinella sp. IMCC34191]
MRFLYLLVLVFFTLTLRAERLEDRLRILMPGEGVEVRQDRRLVEARIEDIVRQLRREDQLAPSPLPDQISRIAARLNGDLLQTYRPDARLIDAIREGIYSDATATILYALSLEQFKIVYEVHVDHWETYLLVDPAGIRKKLHHPLAQEHTELSEMTYRREYLALIRSTAEPNLPPLTEQQSDSLFYRYFYFPYERLTIRQLSGFQQLRLGIHAYADGDYDATHECIAHARQLDNRPAIDVLERAVEWQTMAFSALGSHLETTSLFEKWQREPDDPYYPALLLQTFDRQHRALLASDRLDEVSPLIRQFTVQVPKGRQDWVERLESLREIRLLQYYIENQKVVPALELAERLLKGDEQNPHYRAYVAELSLHEIQRNHAEPEDQVRLAKAAVRKHPFIAKNARYADVMLRESALSIRDHFAADREAEALRELDYFRAQFERLPRGNDAGLWILTAYVAASNYYFAEEDYPTARRYVEEALRLYPQSEFLLHQRDLLARY